MVFEKLKIGLSEKNERIFREIFQFKTEDSPIVMNISLEKFINNWIENQLYFAGFE